MSEMTKYRVTKYRVQQNKWKFEQVIIEGATEKAIHIIMPLKSIHNKKCWFSEQFFYTVERLKQ